MVHRHVFGELLGVAGVRDAVAELLVAARNQAMIEQTDIFEDLAADEQTAGRRELLVFEVVFEGEAGVVVVSVWKCGVSGRVGSTLLLQSSASVDWKSHIGNSS